MELQGTTVNHGHFNVCPDPYSRPQDILLLTFDMRQSLLDSVCAVCQPIFIEMRVFKEEPQTYPSLFVSHAKEKKNSLASLYYEEWAGLCMKTD